jgi:hypothetical protein
MRLISKSYKKDSATTTHLAPAFANFLFCLIFNPEHAGVCSSKMLGFLSTTQNYYTEDFTLQLYTYSFHMGEFKIYVYVLALYVL